MSFQDSADEPATVSFSMEGRLPLSNRLMRDRPAALGGPADAWQLAQQVIDHGVFILDNVNSVTAGRKVRDLILAALLRRALITAEGARVCLFHSLEESAVVLLRTLLETELNMRLVSGDPTEEMATRLAAYHHLKAKRHVTRVLEHPEVQAGDEEFREFMKGAGRRQKEFFASPTFENIRDSLLASQHWHGYKSVAAAFESVGGGTDYLHLYDSFSPFVHVANLDFDFVDIVEDQPHMKALPQRDPRVVQHYLRGVVLVLLRILDLYLEDKNAKQYAEPFTVTFENGDMEQVSPLNALQQQAIAVWGRNDGWSMEPLPSDGEIATD
jgi:uncharacterized protein DUF5677